MLILNQEISHYQLQENERTKFIGVYARKNWFGKPTTCYMVLDGRKITAVWHNQPGCSGYISANLPDCLDVPEAKWLLENHPSSVFSVI